MIKLLACYIDGTLLPLGADALSERVIELLNTITKKGVKLAIASGRSLYDIKRLFSGLERKPCIIADDGALAVGEGKVIYSRPLPLGDMSELLRVYKNNGTPIIFSTSAERLIMENGADRDRLAKCELYGKIARIEELSQLKNEAVYKMSFLWDGEIPARPPVPQNSRIYYRKDGWLEYVPKFADKGLALSALQSLYYADSFNTLVLGNETNDIGMAKKARYSVCIGNSCPQLASVSTVVSDNVLPILEKLAFSPEKFSLPRY